MEFVANLISRHKLHIYISPTSQILEEEFLAFFKSRFNSYAIDFVRIISH